MKIKIYTRSLNEEYYNMMREFLPPEIECERCCNYNEWWEAKTYLNHVLESDADFAINIDDDCFIYNWKFVDNIIFFMGPLGYTHYGMPDRHLSSHRFNLYTVQNPFFNIFNMKEIRKFYKGTMAITKEMDIEPYNSIFLELAFFGKPTWNDRAVDHPDKITTDTGFALHTWYSREPTHRDRIIARYKEAKILKSRIDGAREKIRSR